MLLALAGCRASEAAPGSGLTGPAGWKSLPSLATAARDAAKASGFTVDDADAWGDPARGCYSAALSLTTRLAKPAKLADELMKGLKTEGIDVTGLETPAANAKDGVLKFMFEKAPYRGQLEANIGSNGHITMHVCFRNQREPQMCDATCAQWLRSM
ncbi:MAG TPA: hypothetical protein VL326_01375 [Kofleriaceae bacterium]|nr:hypothetical protein [Kofleriaceae bacterium]